MPAREPNVDLTPRRCSVCGGAAFTHKPVLWPALIEQWQISPAEAAYIDRQQGECCARCGANLRSIALATAIRWAVRTEDDLADFCASPSASDFKVLELNEAGTLHSLLAQMAGHVFGTYPAIDMHALPFPTGSFDLVIHSDTLEHVANPIHALSECRRVLSPGGALCFTVPTIVGRLSRSRDGLAKSHHGNPDESGDDFIVHTEFGADVWTFPLQAGFSTVHLFSFEYPAAIAMTAR